MTDMEAAAARVAAAAPRLSDVTRAKLAVLLGSLGPSDLQALDTLVSRGISFSLAGPMVDRALNVADAEARIWVQGSAESQQDTPEPA